MGSVVKRREQNWRARRRVNAVVFPRNNDAYVTIFKKDY
jgi:hypothetical protein